MSGTGTRTPPNSSSHGSSKNREKYSTARNGLRGSATGRGETHGARLDRKEERQRSQRLDRSERPHDARSERQAEADADEGAGADRHARIFFEGAHQADEENRHRDRERRILRVHEHVTVIERAGRQ